MASVEYRPRMTRVIAYLDKQKHSFPLGRVTKKTAQRFMNNIDSLIHERRCNLPVSREVSHWLVDLDDSVYEMLVERGLVNPRVSAGTLAEFIDAYVDSRTDVTERRREKLRQAKRRLIDFFGDVDIGTVTPGAADEYSRWLLKQVAPTTAQKECQIAAQFFRHAYRKKQIAENPFVGVTVGAATNETRRVFVPREVVDKVLDTAPNWQWRTVVALARYGGLRCSSEVSLLQWSDIHWDTDRFTVTSPKTKRYGKPNRVVPLFPELRRTLEEAFVMAKDGAKWVIPMLSGQPSKNLATTLKKIIRRAGVEIWPKPFQNMRASRQTELEQNFPTHVVCKWLGNTPNVAMKHYLTVTDEDYKKATQTWGQTGDKLGMQTPAGRRRETHQKTRKPHFIRENASFSDVVDILENARIAEEGLELTKISHGI